MVEKGGISSYSHKTIVQIPPFSTTPLIWLSRYDRALELGTCIFGVWARVSSKGAHVHVESGCRCASWLQWLSAFAPRRRTALGC